MAARRPSFAAAIAAFWPPGPEPITKTSTDLPADAVFAKAAATFYQGAREVKAVLSLPQLAETG